MIRPPKDDMVPFSSPRAISSAQCNEKRRIESREVTVSVTGCFIGYLAKGSYGFPIRVLGAAVSTCFSLARLL
jgi:hypothetical protein